MQRWPGGTPSGFWNWRTGLQTHDKGCTSCCWRLPSQHASAERAAGLRGHGECSAKAGPARRRLRMV